MNPAQFDDVVQGEAILPSQWVARLKPSALSPEQSLLCYLLIDAIQCYQGAGSIMDHYEQRPDTKRLRLHLEAERWIFNDDTAWFTFADVCQALDIDAMAIRKALLTWRESGRRPVKIERTVRHSSGAHPTAIRDRIRKDSVTA